ncbi:hypothetical protein Kfla_5177 [Kribbella flavida DSM 17836]|uniref:Uncharacterized protein n=1 Tax=Kribbella flavida (strain DSM 17836 / JCM 10339 / NBRC 14399) TaxID=479435 RepID=D2Q4T7_KRIFD|nr:hypothetical protein [Kribbella flavida]ADB34192.1 hypothetical protein Kfla_5177 [Kribbella flavida DSM 17836]
MAARRRYAVAASSQWIDETGTRLPGGEVHAWEQGLNQTVCGLPLNRARLRRFPHVPWEETFVETGGAADEVQRQCPRCAAVAGKRAADLRPRWRRVNPRP